jgi:hypothetical protein
MSGTGPFSLLLVLIVAPDKLGDQRLVEAEIMVGSLPPLSGDRTQDG